MNRLAAYPVILALAGFSILLAPSMTASAARHPMTAGSAHALPKCWVGTWRDGHEQESTVWNGQKVKMHYSGGDIDHFFANGVDKDNWHKAHSEYGTYQGSTLKETIRGVLTERLHTISHHRYRVTSGHWSKSATNKYRYQGHTYIGYLNSVQPFTSHYTCTSKKLRYYNKKGKLTGVETRISRTP